MYYKCPDCGYELHHDAWNCFGWECLGGHDDIPRHPATRMIEVFPKPDPPVPNTPMQDDLQAILDIMAKHGWSKVERERNHSIAHSPWTHLRHD